MGNTQIKINTATHQKNNNKKKITPKKPIHSRKNTNHLVGWEVQDATALTLRLLMSYIYGAPILDVSRSHTMTQHSR
jgi:hypothetical protein